MNFYCPLDYAHIPSPSPSSPYGHLANNGCGVCCASMVVETLVGTVFPPEQSAVLAKSCGAREGFGTDMRIFAPAFAQEKGLNWESTQDTDRVLEFLQAGRGLVIANTAGDREDWIGVFSNSRHYIVLASAQENTVCVWDPMLAPGRYDTPGRAGKVRLDGFNAYADFSVIIGDCGSRPFYLFSKA